MPKPPKVFQAAKTMNVSVETIMDFLSSKGHKVKSYMTELTDDQYDDLLIHFQKDKAAGERQQAKLHELQKLREKPDSRETTKEIEKPKVEVVEPKVEPEPEPVEIESETPEEIDLDPVEEAVEDPQISKTDSLETEESTLEESTTTLSEETAEEQIEETAKESTIEMVDEQVEVSSVEAVEVPSDEPEHVSEIAIEEPEQEEGIAETGDEEDIKPDEAPIQDLPVEAVKKPELYSRKEVKITLKGKIDLNRANEIEKEFKKKKRKRRISESSTTAQPVASSGQPYKGRERDVRERPELRSDKKPDRPVITPVELSSDPEFKKGKKKDKPDLPDDTPEGEAAKLAKKKKGKKTKTSDLSDSEVKQAIRTTLASMDDSAFSIRAQARKKKKREREEAELKKKEEIQRQSAILKVTEYTSPSELANLMNLKVNEVLSKCLELGLFVSINQRLEKDHIELIAAEFGFDVKFIEEYGEEILEESEEDPSLLQSRPPVVTIMGHVDHGKTSLLDYIRNANVVAGEAGGITQHIGAYSVALPDGRNITFLDTPGHEAFTAMRARGAKVTDVVIIVVAADDSVMPQTLEAINHAQAAGVPMVFAINKIDKDSANPERIYQQLSEKNILVEEWGGKYQTSKVSAKSGIGVEELLEKVLLEAEVLDLKANPDRLAQGTVVESELDKGKGVVATVLVESGTLRVGDIFVCGATWGKVRALVDERGNKLKEVGPAAPAQVLGFDAVPQAGDKMVVMEFEREAREIATRRQLIKREQEQRQISKHMSLDMLSQRMAEGKIQELNIIVKGDVDGSVEALSDSLLKVSNTEVRVRVIHKAVGPITESDVLLASASDAIIIGFQVRPNLNAKKLAESEEIDIRLYSVIYDAINEVKAALEGMLSPDVNEEVTGTLEIRDTFKISKIGTIAGCYVLDGQINRSDRVRIIRDGVVIYTGELETLKRFKDDVKEVQKGFECGLNIKNFNDIKNGDIIEPFRMVETKRTL